MKTRQDIWVEKITLLGIIVFLLRNIFSNIHIYYDGNSISTLLNKSITIIKRLNISAIFTPVELKYNILDSNGAALEYQYQKDLDRCSRLFCESLLTNKYKHLKEISHNFIASKMEKSMKFIEMVQAILAKQTKHKQIILLVANPINYLIIQYFRGSTFMIQQTLLSKHYIRMIVWPFYGLFLSFFLFFHRNAKSKSNIKEIKPAIWIEYYSGLIGKTKRAHSIYFWQDYIKIENYDLVFYIDRPDTPAKIAVEEITACREKWIDVTKFQLYRLAHFKSKDFKEIIFELLDYNLKLPIWFHSFKCESFVSRKIYTSIYRHYKVKALIQHREVYWKSGIQAKAVEDAGGIMIGFHWSICLSYIDPMKSNPFHVYFAWGNINYEWVQRNGNTCRFILPSGLWILPDDIPPGELNEFSELVKFKLALFDTSEVSNLFYFSPENFAKFWLLIIKLLDENPTWGAIVKRKCVADINDLAFLPRGDELLSKVKSFIAQNRMVFLDPKISPVTASANADLSVCFTLNSAGIISATHGHHVIHWDCSGWRKLFFYKTADNHIIYESLDKLECAIIKFSQGDRSIGDFSAYSHIFNYFYDTLGPKRVGIFITNFMEKVLEVGNVNQALNFAVENYMFDNKIANDFYEIRNYYGEE